MKIALLISLLIVSTALAEEPAAAEKKPEWESNAELSLLLTSGNTEITTIGLGLGSAYKPDPWTIKAKANYLTSSDAGINKAESLSGELRGERKITEPLALFLQATYLKNRFSGFDDRIGGEAGVSYLLLAGDTHTVTTEVGFGVTKENRTDTTSQSFASGRLGAEYKWKLSPTAELSNLVSFLDNLSTTRDWRVANTASLTAILTSVLSLKASFKVEHLNVPVTGKRKTDTTTTVALVAKF